MSTSAIEDIDILFTFDTTGSMYPCLGELRRKLDAFIEKLFGKVKGLRVAIIAHGDYCDAGSTYVTKALDFTDKPIIVRNFVRTVERTGGGDAPECYEAVLNEARTLSWTAKRRRVLVMLGDDVPHGANEAQNRKRLDWKNEANLLTEMGVEVYAGQCLNRSHATSFYTTLAKITGGRYFTLNQFQHIDTFLLGVAAQQAGPEVLQAFEDEVRRGGNVPHAVEDIFDTLASRAAKKRHGRTDGLVPVDPARFQVFNNVTGEPQIKDFVLGMGIEFKKGRGFYPHITRTETIQEHKEIILEDRVTGEFFTGTAAREMIGLPYGSRGDIRPNPVPGFICWVQSTSVNRKLREAAFMYEVPDKV
jgi:hypothetical protein